jgi:WD40-like Beta Propeller Repeat
LARHISVLRQVLGQAQSGVQYIETVPKRGYRFVAPVRQVDPSPAEVQPKGTAPAGPLPILRLRGVALAGAVVLLAAGAAILGWRRSSDAVPQYTQLTNYADSATSPALSPDGRLLAFIRGENTFQGRGEIYVRLLPDGEPFQLTHDNLAKMGPAFLRA